MKSYKVVIEEVVTREYVVDAHTPEEAESIAETWKLDGEPGIVINTELIGTEALEDESDEEPYDPEEEISL